METCLSRQQSRDSDMLGNKNVFVVVCIRRDENIGNMMHMAGVANTFCKAIDFAWDDAINDWDSTKSYTIFELETEKAGKGVQAIYSPELMDCDKSEEGFLKFRESWETLETLSVPYASKAVPNI